MADGKWVEVQIRTERMDEIAEKGQAAHWRYKGFDRKEDTDAWLAQVRDILENPEQIKFDDPGKIGKKSDKIFIYTPNGDLKELRPGSTVLDFAYEIHTRVGDTCNGARVNDQVVPIRHVLNNGDKVEVITSKTQKPKLDWLQFVKTTKAKNKIKRALKEERFKEAEIGNEILRRKLKNWKLVFNDELIDRLVKHYKLSSSIDLYGLIAEEKLDLNGIKKVLLHKKEGPEKARAAEQETAIEEAEAKESIRRSEPDALVIDDKLDKVNYKLAKCCNPIAGDKVFGFVTIGKGITIHRINCPNARRLLENYGYRKINVTWKTSEQALAYHATIKVLGKDKIGMLEEITNVISKDLRVNMLSIKVDSGDGAFLGLIRVQVKDNKHLDELLHKLSKIKGIDRAIRIDS
jgi:GTP pyrophosphokinase